MTFRGLSSSVLAQFGMKYPGNLWQFYTVRMCTTAGHQWQRDVLVPLLYCFFRLHFVAGPVPKEVKLAAIFSL